MLENTKTIINAALASDPTVTNSLLQRINRVCAGTVEEEPKKQISAKQAMEILGVSRPTLRRLAQDGAIKQINLSCRKVRFDEKAVLEFAANGVCR